MGQDSRIIYQEGQGEVVEKKSRFIAYIFPAKTEEEALARIQEIRKKHYDARHNCFAYVIGDKNETERCSDDGEPSGTAGRPMLEVLTGQGIHNAVAVVTRYFGGTLLGTGGLVRAYTAAMQEGLKNCQIMEQKEGIPLKVQTDYNGIGKLQYLARSLDLKEMDTQYGETVTTTLLVPRDDLEKVEKEITEQTAGKALLDAQDMIKYGLVDGQVVFL
ncbi:MAG: YigZ family protein [Eubacterium sp.]|nr:YigZ family protein [Eubacterium sp.]